MSDWHPIDSAPRHRIVQVSVAGLGVYRAIFGDWQDGATNPRWRPLAYTVVDEFPPGATITHWTDLQGPAAPSAAAQERQL